MHDRVSSAAAPVWTMIAAGAFFALLTACGDSSAPESESTTTAPTTPPAATEPAPEGEGEQAPAPQ
jgi:hypothetical protein